MANQPAADSTLLSIKNKVRRLTRSLSEAQLTDAQLTQYINTYILYDFPETLRLFNLKQTFTFYTLPFIDTYSTTDNINSPLYNFTNTYITTDQPVYIAGFKAGFYESRDQFYNMYPLTNSVANIGMTGNGVINYFQGVINTSQSNIPQGSTQYITLLKNNVLFSAIDVNGNGLAMADSPIIDSTTGNQTNYGLLYDSLNILNQPVLYLSAPYTNQLNFPNINYINYLTGQYYVSFSGIPAAGSTINSQTVQVNASRPQSLLFFDGEFIVRPVPDQSYRVQMEVFAQPIPLLADSSNPILNEWWQLIAFNAAKKIFEDRMDYDSLGLMIPSLKEQENLVNRRTIKQYTSQRVSTIYSGQNGQGQSGQGWNNCGGLF